MPELIYVLLKSKPNNQIWEENVFSKFMMKLFNMIKNAEFDKLGCQNKLRRLG